MNSIKQTCKNVKTLVDSFLNSTTPIFCTPTDEPKDTEAWYSTWEDNYIGDFLNNPVVKAGLKKIADFYCAKQLDVLLRHSSELKASSYPQLYRIYKECCKRLGFVKIPKLYITYQIIGINALSLEVKGHKLILLSRMATIRLNEKELRFILGHELGHHQQGNLVCHTVNGLLDTFNTSSEIFGPMISDTIEVPMKRWCRQSEFNADRAGYICCGDIDAVTNLFLKLGMESVCSAYNEYKELEDAHPHLQTRFTELKKIHKTIKVNR